MPSQYLYYIWQLLFVDIGNAKSSIAAAFPPLLLAALASMKAPKEIISSLDTAFLLNPILLQTFCLIPFTTLVYQSIMNPVYLNFSSIPICTVAFITMMLMYMYNKNRAHKHNGYLLTSEMASQSIFAAISMLLSSSIIMEIKPDSILMLVVFLLGSMFMLLMCSMFASVADVWYTVGSGQFQMVSLDTVGIMVYFICPAVILHLRFVDRYGESIVSKIAMLKEYLESSGFPAADGDGGDFASFSLVMTLVMITSIGVPMLNALCPMGGYLFSRAYTHGQPNTKKVALCINFSDLPKDVDKLQAIWNALLNKKKSDQITAVLNIFVTLEDLTLYRDNLKEISKRGHSFALAPSEYHEESFCDLSMFQGNKSSCNLHIAHYEYSKILGKEPTWILAKSADSAGRHPALLSDAKDLGMKTAYWSTTIQLTGELTTEQQSAISGECSAHDGGSIIYVTLGKGVSPNDVSSTLGEVVDRSFFDLSLESLSDVVKDDAKMVLKKAKFDGGDLEPAAKKVVATAALQDAVDSAINDANGEVDAKCLQRAVQAGYSKFFVLAAEKKVTATAALQDAVDSAINDANGEVDAKCLQRAVQAGYSKFFVLAEVAKQMEG